MRKKKPIKRFFGKIFQPDSKKRCFGTFSYNTDRYSCVHNVEFQRWKTCIKCKQITNLLNRKKRIENEQKN